MPPSANADPSASGRARPAASATRWALGLLVVVNVVSQIDRQIMNILVEPVKAEFGLSDSQIGLLVGLAFALFHTFAGIPIARIADRWSRRNLIAICLAVWSCMTAISGLARNFGELLVARVGVGVGEAGCSPSAQSLIGDYFPPEARGRALSIYQLGVPIGILVGLAFGGYVSDRLGWRAAFFVVGLPGLILAVVTWMGLLEPPRGSFEKSDQASQEVEPVGTVLRYLWRQRTMRHMLIAASLHTATAASHVTFNPAFLQRYHGLSGTEAGLALGFVTGIAGGLGTFAGGWFGDRLGLRDPRWYIWTPMIAGIVSIPFSWLAYTTQGTQLAIFALALALLGNLAYSGVVHAVFQSLVGSRMRALTAAIALFSMNLLGYGGGPTLAGLLSDLFGGEGALRHSLLAMNGVLAWACVHYAWATRSYRGDLAAGGR
ncbi:MAG: MFS transporter [Deltaproteobacteria bacterium]|nr:MFS transporter [Deltaproteobacteria bacterium]